MIRLIAILLIIIEYSYSGTGDLDKKLYSKAVKCIDYTYNEDYNSAEKTAEDIIEKNRDDPSGYFLRALV